MTEDDPLGVRADFPVCSEGAYLNSAYITPHPIPVLEAGREFLEAKARAPWSLEAMLEETERAREAVSGLIGASATEVGFVQSTSEGENILANALDLGPGDNVVVDALHYNTAYLLYGHLARTRGVELRIAPERDGRIHLEDVRPLIDANTRIVSIAWIAHQNGFRHDLKAWSEVAHRHDAVFYVDAIQGLGTLALDVRDAGVDVLTAGTFKWLLGGFGSAVMYVREGLHARLSHDRFGAMHIVGGTRETGFKLPVTPKKFEYATLAFGSIVQLRAGVDYLKSVGVERIEAHAVSLAARASDGLRGQGFNVLTPPNNASTIVSFVHGQPIGRAKDELAHAGVVVTFRADDHNVRVSCALFNNAADVDALLDVTARWI